MDTIFALTSGAPPCAIAVVRVSGPSAGSVAERLTGRALIPRVAVLTNLKIIDSSELIDRGLMLWFPSPNSFTGEDCVEFHVHGSRAVIGCLFETLSKFPNCRPAAAGEFSRRAYVNGKLDLTRLEGLGDLINSDTDAQRRQAIGVMMGGLKSTAEAWRVKLIDILTLVEADIDFSDEGDVLHENNSDIRKLLEEIKEEFHQAILRARTGVKVRDGFSVVILGPPNAGKSALLNWITQREIAIVSPQPGTTRDVLEANIDLKGLPVSFFDTAGVRDGEDLIEVEGVRRAFVRAKSADLAIWLTEFSNDQRIPDELIGTNVLEVRSKADLCENWHQEHPHDLAVSSHTGIGLRELLDAIYHNLCEREPSFEPALISRSRQVSQISAAHRLLQCACEADIAPELIADDLRCAVRCIEELSGKIDSEDVLDSLFSSFCIGK